MSGAAARPNASIAGQKWMCSVGIVPSNRLQRLEFYEQHIEGWITNATALGLAGPAMTALGVAIANARSAYSASLAARLASKAATQAFYEELAAAHKLGSEAIELIKNKAQSTNDPSIYTLAQLPSPASPGSVPPPGTPFDFRITLQQGGALGLSWKCNNPAGAVGTIYEVRRQAMGAPANEWTFAGATGTREFLDETLPSTFAATGVNYEIRGRRSTSVGVPAIFGVRFGIAGGGGGAGGVFTIQSITPLNNWPMNNAA